MNNFKIAMAQVPSVKGDVGANMETHRGAIAEAGDRGVAVLVFPELSLTGYEPELAKTLALTIDDARLSPLVQAAKEHGLYAVVGAPLAADGLPKIGAIIISPAGEVSTYLKMHLHAGEERYFSAGNTHRLLETSGQRIAMAICADTNAPEHAKGCADKGATIYAAGVLMTEGGYAADAATLESYARTHGMLVAIANYNKPTGGWSPSGRSAIWSPSGLIAAADAVQSALVVAENSADGWLGELVEL